MRVSAIVALKGGSHHVASFIEWHREVARVVDLEILVWDGGPADGAEEALRASGLVAVYQRGPDSGIYDAWNRVLEFASGEYFCFVGIDDRLGGPWLQAALYEAQEARKPHLLYGDLLLKRKQYYRRRSFGGRERLSESDIRAMPFAHPGALHHRSLFVARQFDTRFKLAGDLEFLIRAAVELGGLSVRRVEGVQVEMGAEGASHSSNAFAIYRGEYQVIESLHGVRLAHSQMRLALMGALFARFPGLFSLVRDVRWRMLGSRSA